MAILCGAPSTRDVIAFPKTAGKVDAMLKSPSPISAETLALYGLAPRLTVPSVAHLYLIRFYLHSITKKD